MIKVISNALLLAIITIATISCKKEETSVVKENSYSNQISKIEKEYSVGCNKLETVATSAQAIEKLKLSTKVESALVMSVSKTNLKAALAISNPVGVLRYSTGCGSYPSIKIHLDCEDGDWKTNIGGNRSDSRAGITSVDKNGNLNLEMCVVSGSNFTNNGFPYAVFSFHTGTINSSKIFSRIINCEDSGNANSISTNSTTPLLIERLNQHIALTFDVFSENAPNIWPNLGINYGVFGRFGNYVNIYTDDEDANNLNGWLSNSRWDLLNANAVNRGSCPAPYNGIFTCSANTSMGVVQIR